MAKQNVGQGFAKWFGQTAKLNTKSRRNAIGFITNKWALSIVISIVLTYVLFLYKWCVDIEKTDVFFDFLAEKMIDSILIVIETMTLLASIVLHIKRKIIFSYICAYSCILIFFIQFVATNFKVYGSYISDKQTEEIHPTEVASQNTESEPTFMKKLYVLEEDVFVDDLGLYLGVQDNSILDEDRVGKIAEFVEKTLKDSYVEPSDETEPGGYVEAVITADALYEAYTKVKDIGETQKSSNVTKSIRIEGIQILLRAKDLRLQADESYKNTENRRLIALYNIDLGDDYIYAGENESAAICYEEAAEWAINSIYSAAIINNKDKMQAAFIVLDNATLRLEEFESYIGEERVIKVRNCRDAYKIVIDAWNQ